MHIYIYILTHTHAHTRTHTHTNTHKSLSHTHQQLSPPPFFSVDDREQARHAEAARGIDFILFYCKYFSNFFLWEIGNKLDMAKQREVSFEEADAFAKDNALIYLEVPVLGGGRRMLSLRLTQYLAKSRFQRKRDKMSKKPFCERPTKFMTTSRFVLKKKFKKMCVCVRVRVCERIYIYTERESRSLGEREKKCT